MRLDGEQLLALEDFCRAAGVPGCWTAEGPTQRAQLLLRSRSRREAAAVRFALALTFRAWRGEGPGPEAIEVLALDAQLVDALAVLAHRWNGRPPRRR